MLVVKQKCKCNPMCQKLADQNYQHYISILVCYTIIDTPLEGMVIDIDIYCIDYM